MDISESRDARRTKHLAVKLELSSFVSVPGVSCAFVSFLFAMVTITTLLKTSYR